MKKIISLALISLLTACASAGSIQQQNESPTQNYRLQGANNPVAIGGTLQRLNDGSGGYLQKITVTIDGVTAAAGYLDKRFNGEVMGQWQNKQISSVCSSKTAHGRANERMAISCMVFVDNERTITLTFN